MGQKPCTAASQSCSLSLMDTRLKPSRKTSCSMPKSWPSRPHKVHRGNPRFPLGPRILISVPLLWQSCPPPLRWPRTPTLRDWLHLLLSLRNKLKILRYGPATKNLSNNHQHLINDSFFIEAIMKIYTSVVLIEPKEVIAGRTIVCIVVLQTLENVLLGIPEVHQGLHSVHFYHKGVVRGISI